MHGYSHLQQLIAVRDAARRIYRECGKAPGDLRIAREASAAVIAAQDDARYSFGVERGWLHTLRGFTVDQLRRGSNVRRSSESWERGPIDHADYYRAGRPPWRPVAIVSHEYSSFDDSLVFAANNGLIAELLPTSWWSPGRCNAVLYTASRKSQQYQ